MLSKLDSFFGDASILLQRHILFVATKEDLTHHTLISKNLHKRWANMPRAAANKIKPHRQRRITLNKRQ